MKPERTPIHCPACNATGPQIVRIAREVMADDGTNLVFNDELSQCEQCGERFYTQNQAMASSRARAGALREHEGLLTPHQIRALRKRLDLSQAGLERVLGVGAKTV